MIRPYLYCPYCASPLNAKMVGGRPRRVCPGCSFIHFENPLPTTGAIASRDGHYALIRRGVEPGKGRWSLPSGFVEMGEDAQAACLRELREETGLEGSVRRLLDVYHVDSRTYGDVLVIIFEVTVTGGILRAGDDAVEARWFAPEAVPDLSFACFNDAISRALAGRREDCRE